MEILTIGTRDTCTNTHRPQKKTKHDYDVRQNTQSPELCTSTLLLFPLCANTCTYTDTHNKQASFPLHHNFSSFPPLHNSKFKGKGNISAKLVMLITEQFSGGEKALNGF